MNMQQRDKFDSENLGGFRRSYPNPNPKLQAKYNRMLEESKFLWNETAHGALGRPIENNNNLVIIQQIPIQQQQLQQPPQLVQPLIAAQTQISSTLKRNSELGSSLIT